MIAEGRDIIPLDHSNATVEVRYIEVLKRPFKVLQNGGNLFTHFRLIVLQVNNK